MPKKPQDLSKSQEQLEPVELGQEAASNTEQGPAGFEIEKKPEAPVSAPAEVMPAKEAVQQQVEQAAPSATAPARSSARKAEIEKIENILAEDLEDIYFQLPADKKAVFKQTGEKTALEIDSLLHQVKIKVKKIFELITNWLKIVPGVSKFFLQQEAKIKTDKILDLKEQGNIDTQTNQDKNKI